MIAKEIITLWRGYLEREQSHERTKRKNDEKLNKCIKMKIKVELVRWMVERLDSCRV